MDGDVSIKLYRMRERIGVDLLNHKCERAVKGVFVWKWSLQCNQIPSTVFLREGKEKIEVLIHWGKSDIV